LWLVFSFFLFFFIKKKKTKKKSIFRSSEHIWKNYKEKLIECKFNRLIKRNQKSFLNTTVAKPSHQVPTCTNTATKMLPRTPRKNHFWRPTRYEMRQGSQASFFFFFFPLRWFWSLIVSWVLNFIPLGSKPFSFY
jgi:hypothetical protein